MAILDFFLSRKKNTACIAKERLQIIVAERRRGETEPHYLPNLKKEEGFPKTSFWGIDHGHT